jgi:hypothetical protein
MTRFIVLLDNLLLHFINHYMPHYIFSCLSSSTAVSRTLSILSSNSKLKLKFLFIQIVGDGVKLGALGTAATNSPIVPIPDDYDDGEYRGMTIGKGNRSTRRRPAPVPLFPSQIPHAVPGRELGLPQWEASD